MATPLDQKSPTDKIRIRFDNDVDRFSQLETGQSSTIDAPLVMELIAQAAKASTKNIRCVLDIGCGAGNNTLKLHEILGHHFDVDLLDLSGNMLERAQQRVSDINSGKTQSIQSDFRDAPLESGKYDVILAAAVLHHLRDENDWLNVFKKIHDVLAPGGSVWISDLVIHDSKHINALMWNRYSEYLVSVGGTEYRDKVFDYIDKEDSPRSTTFQLELLRRVGFKHVDLLHKNSCFAAFGAIK